MKNQTQIDSKSPSEVLIQCLGDIVDNTITNISDMYDIRNDSDLARNINQAMGDIILLINSTYDISMKDIPEDTVLTPQEELQLTIEQINYRRDAMLIQTGQANLEIREAIDEAFNKDC